MDINVKVVNQDLTMATNLRCLPKGTNRFIRFTFHMDEDWAGLNTFVQFVQGENHYNVNLDANNSACLPNEIVAGKCYMVLCGTLGNVRATTKCLELNITEVSTPTAIRVRQGGI